MVKFLYQYARWDVILGIVLMGALTAWEIAGVANGRLLTITAFLKHILPMPIRIMIWAWLGWHFIISDLFAGVK